jgi:amidophosphoribosyltransferase
MCGYVGLIGSAEAAAEVHMALMALQHRGQDSAGMGEFDQLFRVHRGLGKVPVAIDEQALALFNESRAVIGHVRYPTRGTGHIEDAQPFFANPPGIILAHNGNVTNVEELAERLAGHSVRLRSRCDAEPMVGMLASHLLRARPFGHTEADLVAAVRHLLDEVRGGYTAVLGMILDGKPTLAVFRDRNGLRPCVIGRRGDAWMSASESVALDPLEFTDRFSPEPGELVLLREGEEPIRHRLVDCSPSPCIFEKIYFARPDAIIDNTSVYEARMNFGAELAGEWRAKGFDADVVVPIPDTSRPAAQAFAETLGLPYREGFIKNRYSGRTFIMPDIKTRTRALRLKLNPIPPIFRGKKVVLFDDSVVRGATIQRIAEMVRKLEPAELHLAVHSPPVNNPCYYGIDMSTRSELFASQYFPDGYTDREGLRSVETAMARDLGLDSVTYLSVEGVDAAYKGPRCAACFDGKYPQPLLQTDRNYIEADRRKAAGRSASETTFSGENLPG